MPKSDNILQDIKGSSVPLPEISFETSIKNAGGIVVSGSNFQQLTKGKPGLLVVYAPWCSHCKSYLSTLVHIIKMVVQINQNRNPPYWVGVMNGDVAENSTFLKTLNVHAYPTLILFDKNGKYNLYTKDRSNSQQLFDDLTAL